MENESIDKQAKKTTKREQARWIAVGMAIGAGIGVAMGNIAIGVGIGLALGTVIGLIKQNKCKKTMARNPLMQRKPIASSSLEFLRLNNALGSANRPSIYSVICI